VQAAATTRLAFASGARPSVSATLAARIDDVLGRVAAADAVNRESGPKLSRLPSA
jgi:hypothetical protein